MKREHETRSLTSQEMDKAKLFWDMYIQEKCYADVIESIKIGKRCNLKDQLNLTRCVTVPW